MTPVTCYRCNKRRHVLLASAAGYICCACVDVLKRLDEQEESPKCCAICHQPMPLDGKQWVHPAQHAAPFLLCSEACFKRCREELQSSPFVQKKYKLRSWAEVCKPVDTVPIESGEGIVLPEQPGDRERFLGMSKEQLERAFADDPLLAGMRRQRENAKKVADESYALQVACFGGPKLMTPKDCLVSMIGLTEENADKVLAGTARWAEDGAPVVMPNDVVMRPLHEEAAPSVFDAEVGWVRAEKRPTAFEEAWDELCEGLPKVNDYWVGFTTLKSVEEVAEWEQMVGEGKVTSGVFPIVDGCPAPLVGKTRNYGDMIRRKLATDPSLAAAVKQETKLLIVYKDFYVPAELANTALLTRLLNLREAEYARCELGPFLVRCGQAVWDHLNDDMVLTGGLTVCTVRQRLLHVEGIKELVMDHFQPPTGMALQSVGAGGRSYGTAAFAKVSLGPEIDGKGSGTLTIPVSQEEDGCQPDARVEGQP